MTYTLSGNDESNLTISSKSSNGASIKFNITPDYENPQTAIKIIYTKSP